ncbi:hypothetical protein AWB83_00959 [Caballeronia ptereochthonis]|uniref:Surface antigen domain-containing protein n=2 Tax=Caballeronia ptereochthonis TaxID=1777144 RepID=A0A157ZRG1_9BURK|nr:hypothetical protein AWB83_00959 [Caballeronia ptereochthonis]
MPLFRRIRALPKHCMHAALAAAIFVNGAGVQAHNLNFLDDTPLSYMKPRDMTSIKHALAEVLSTKGDGQTSQWTNEGTGNSVKIEASMTPERTTQDANKTCRQIAVVLSAKGQSLNLHPLFCRAGKTDWALQKR